MRVSLFPMLVLAALVGGCASPSTTAPPEPAPVAVSMAHVEAAAFTSFFEAGGVVRPRATAVVASRIMAPVVDVHVRPGDRVRRGARLITLDGREISANRTRAGATLAGTLEAAHAAESDVRAAQAALALARATHDRIQALHDKRSATPQELDQARSALDAADARLAGTRAQALAAAATRDAAQAASAGADVAGSYAVLTAPFDGLVTERAVDPGSMATPGAPLLTIEDTSAFRLEVPLDESRATQVSAGKVVDVRIGDAASADSWTAARISEIARLDAASHSFLIKLDLADGSGLRSGTFGRARFPGSTRQGLAVPSSAAVRRGQLTFVFALGGDGRARLQPVSPGVVTADRMEVLAGLQEGDRVIINPPPSLTDGTRVNGDRP